MTYYEKKENYVFSKMDNFKTCENKYFNYMLGFYATSLLQKLEYPIFKMCFNKFG